MTTRNRTLLFNQFRRSLGLNNYVSDDINLEKEGLIGNKGGGQAEGSVKEFEVIELGVLPPKWVDINDEIKEELLQITNNMNKLNNLYNNRLMPGFHDRSKEEKLIEQLTLIITNQFYNSQSKLKTLSFSEMGTAKLNELICKNVQSGLAQRLQDLSTKFKLVQSNYLQKLKSREGGSQMEGINEEIKEFELESQLQSQSQVYQSNKNSELINQREREIDEIAKSIGQLAEIFKSLSTLVIDQGTLIDQIDYNVEQLNTNINSAVMELHQAVKYQRSKSGKMCILLLLILIGVFFILVLYKYFTK